jgi:hypothetical protein
MNINKIPEHWWSGAQEFKGSGAEAPKNQEEQ